jgi:hypothetical protein
MTSNPLTGPRRGLPITAAQFLRAPHKVRSLFGACARWLEPVETLLISAEPSRLVFFGSECELLRGSPSAPPARRLDGRSKTLLAASIKALPYETPGWITNKEAKQLFSSMDDEYAFGEMDEAGKGNIADFAAHVTPRCSFEFMPVEGRVYFMRKADAGP